MTPEDPSAYRFCSTRSITPSHGSSVTPARSIAAASDGSAMNERAASSAGEVVVHDDAVRVVDGPKHPMLELAMAAADILVLVEHSLPDAIVSDVVEDDERHHRETIASR